MNPRNQLTKASRQKAGITVALILAGFALRARGAPRAILLLISGALLVKSAQRRPNTESPSEFGEGERDQVDEASWESFPASDPPAYSPLSV